jgi:hypothetical protein
MQDRLCQIDKNLLQRTAGPYIGSIASLSASLPSDSGPQGLLADFDGSDDCLYRLSDCMVAEKVKDLKGVAGPRVSRSFMASACPQA